jgi:cobalt-precorrin 5A hydrolase
VAAHDADHTMDGDQALMPKIQMERLSIGFGCSSLAESDEIARLIKASIDPIPQDSVLATLDRRASMGEIISHLLGIRLVVFPADTLARIQGTTTHSPQALARTGTPNVAEAAALAALGPNARLIVARTKGRFCTCAVAAISIEVAS